MTALVSREVAAALWAERREVRRLSHVSRRASAATGLSRPTFRMTDGALFAAQYFQMFVQNALASRALGVSPCIMDCEAGFRLQIQSGRSTPRPRFGAAEFCGIDLQLGVWRTGEVAGP